MPRAKSTHNASWSKPNRYLDIDRDLFNDRYNRLPFALRHRLTGHPLFELERLTQLGKSLPAKQVQYHLGNVAVATNFETAATHHSNNLTIEETIANIEVNGSYVLMKNVETDPEYGRLLDELLDEIQILSEPLDPGMTDRVAFLMISSPHAITPYHMDREMNFLLQVQGNKEVHLWDPADRQVVSEDELETYFAWHSLAKTKYRDEIQSKAHVFKLTPGDGVHHPSTAPHWVKNGNEVSISFSTTFWSRASKRRDLVYRSNFALRRLGLKPRPFGESPLIDSVKHRGFRAYSAAKRLLGR